ncbi:putative calcium-binding protein CML24 [Dendrobium catenatum]|uniref:Putative calcium-binding protein CML24 n=1 Tax=Dendrobium catenatum TaxID=906689 RepID=A0A2I0WKC2_9ASPA|nr:putative calcium-binding protein CML24 [Dendrobium catenatum]
MAKPTTTSLSPSPSARRPCLRHPSPSFRLRSPSLNSVRLRRIFDLFDHNGDGEITLGRAFPRPSTASDRGA